MIAPSAQVQAPTFSVQMVEAYLYEASLVRRPRNPDESPEPSLDLRPRVVSREEAVPRFSVCMTVEIRLPFGSGLGDATAEFKVSVLGVFEYTGDLDEELFRVFPDREAVVMLWPYLRAAAGQLGSMTGLQLPLLPTLDVVKTLSAAHQPLSPDDSEKKPAPRRRKRKANTTE